MKRSTADAALPVQAAEAPTKLQRRSTPPMANPAAAENGRSAGEDDGGGKISKVAGRQQLSPPLPAVPAPAPAAEEVVAGWCDVGATEAAAEIGEWWCCPSGVEEEKLSGWFPFAEEDFLCGGGGAVGRRSSGGGEEEEWGGELLWEAADIDIWQLQHIHEIPRATSK